MHDSIKGFTIEEYLRATGSLIFDVRNGLLGFVGYVQLAHEEFDPSHPAFENVANALRIAEAAFSAVKQFDQELFHRKNEAETLEARNPSPPR